MSYTINPPFSPRLVSRSCNKSPAHTDKHTHTHSSNCPADPIKSSFVFTFLPLHVTDKLWPVVLKLWFRDSRSPWSSSMEVQIKKRNSSILLSKDQTGVLARFKLSSANYILYISADHFPCHKLRLKLGAVMGITWSRHNSYNKMCFQCFKRLLNWITGLEKTSRLCQLIFIS